MARRRYSSGLGRMLDGLTRDVRAASRQRERDLRHGRAGAERQGRALARLRRAEEREEALAAAAQEHTENEELLAAIRDLLRLAPAEIRERSAFEKALERSPFPTPERIASDSERLKRESAERIARVSARMRPAVALLLFLSVLMIPGGIALSIAYRVAGLVVFVAGVLLLGLAAWRNRRDREAFLSAEGARIRSEVTSMIAGDLERDRAEHERREDARIQATRRLLQGDPGECAAAFRKAAEALDMPFEASAALAMVLPDAAEIGVNLHAEGDLPAQRSTLLKTGRLSYRNRPKKELREEDARSIAALCILYAALAFDEVPSVERLLVSAFREGIDPATGQDAELCHASVLFERGSFRQLKLDRLDPIAALRSFENRFSLSSAFVLKTVEPLVPEDLSGDALPEGQEKEDVRARSVTRPGRRSALEIAEQALALATACGRADGRLAPQEVDAISRILEERFSLPPSESRRLALRRAALAEEEISIEGPAAVLREALAPRERQLFLEQILSVVAADGRLSDAELALCRSVGAALDVSQALFDDLARRWAPNAGGATEGPAPGRAGTGKAGAGGVGLVQAAAGEAIRDGSASRGVRPPEGGRPAGDRSRWLADLELPRDAKLDRTTIERAARRIEELYGEERFRLLAPELREMATRRRELARSAAEALLADFPQPTAAASAVPEEGGVRRENPDLDSIFG